MERDSLEAGCQCHSHRPTNSVKTLKEYLRHSYRQGSHSFTDKKSRTFPGATWKIFQDLFGARECLNIKKKTAFTYNIQSVVHCRKFPFEPLEKCMTFKDIFPGLSRTLSFNFKDFPGPKWFSRTFQVLEFSRKNPGLSRRRGNPVQTQFFLVYYCRWRGLKCCGRWHTGWLKTGDTTARDYSHPWNIHTRAILERNVLDFLKIITNAVLSETQHYFCQRYNV